MGELINNECLVPAQRSEATGSEEDFWPAGQYESPIGPQTLPETLDDDFVDVCQDIASRDFVGAVAIAAWDEYFVEQAHKADLDDRMLKGTWERMAGTMALANGFFQLTQHVSEGRLLQHYLPPAA